MGLSIEKLLLIGVIALFLVGPERLPDYAQRLGRFVRQARRMFDDAKDRVKEELGPDFDEEEWKKLDPRQYDPRRIIRDALLEPSEPRQRPQAREDDDPVPVPVTPAAAAPAVGLRKVAVDATRYDDEAT